MMSGRAGRASARRGRTFGRGVDTLPTIPGASRRRTPATVSLIIPALNEAANIAWVLGRIPADVADEVILVDGLSIDDTVAIAKATMADIIMVNEHRPGKGCALRAGFEAATSDIIVMLDADGSMDPAEITMFVEAIASGYDFVKGSRHLADGGSEDLTWLRSFGNKALGGAVNILYGTRFTDLCYGFMAFRRDCLRALNLSADGFEIETQMVVNAVKSGLRIAEVPSFELERRSGQSNLRTFRDGRRVLRTLVRERFALPRSAVADVVDLTEPSVIDLVALEETPPEHRLQTGA
jgi:glycosyltransferase involved in cell wall biosynthesis